MTRAGALMRGAMLALTLNLLLPADAGAAMHTPCSGSKGGIARCEGSRFVCRDGTKSASKRDCRVYIAHGIPPSAGFPSKGAPQRMNAPCSGRKGGIARCAGSQFICRDGTKSASRRDCRIYQLGLARAKEAAAARTPPRGSSADPARAPASAEVASQAPETCVAKTCHKGVLTCTDGSRQRLPAGRDCQQWQQLREQAERCQKGSFEACAALGLDESVRYGSTGGE